MTSHHIIYDITCTVFMTSPQIYLRWHPPYLCHHNVSIDDLRPTLCMTSHPLYVCQLMHSIQHHIHSLWLQTIVVITLHPLHSWHHTPYIWHHTHGNTNVISTIWPALSNTTSTVSVSSKTGYQLYHNLSLYDITQTICVTSYSGCILLKHLFMTSYPSVYNITPSIFMTSYSIRMLSPYCFHDNTTTIPDISPTIFDITATVSVSIHTSVSMLLYRWPHNKCVSHHTWQTCDNIPNLNHITFTVYDKNDHVLWHHKHSIPDIRSPLHVITSTL